ncbi:MAG TPA: hypothetical protein VM307_02020 [Egibacteraceae bacterium]|nr:hypothetical protein [Egibacteraceae bacterium]
MRRTAPWIAWSMWLLGVVLIVSAGLLSAAYPAETTTTDDPVSNFVWVSSWLGFGLVGALIVTNRPDNRIGWVLCGITLAVGLAVFGPSYGRAAYQDGLPLGALATWVGAWGFIPSVGLVLGLLLLFPDGRGSGRGRRWLGCALVALVAAETLVYAFRPGPVEGDGPPFNPLGIDAIGAQLDALTGALGTAIGACALLVLGNLVWRFRRSRGVERQQFRWFAFAALTFPVLFAFIQTVAPEPEGFDPITLVFALCGNGLAAAIGIAVTRHGLYEINRVISRTISYALLTVLLVGLYLGAVTLLTAVTAPVTGDSPIAVAAATLAAAAAFGPARRRIQSAVDRRFNRARYDAGRTVETYRGRIRDEVDVSAVADGLLATVTASMQPASAALWLVGDTGAVPGVGEKTSERAIAVTVPERPDETKGP